MEKKDKIELLKKIESGKGSIKDLRPLTVIELHRFEIEPGFYYDKEGNRFNEEQKENLFRRAQRNSSICWKEIRTYKIHEDYIHIHKNNS